MKETITELFGLQGKKAIVTGGGKGIGRGIVKALCMAGAEVVIVGSSQETEAAAKEMSENFGVVVHGLQYDLSNLAGIGDLFERCKEILGGRVDILINNAGIQRRYSAEQFPSDELIKVINVNQLATFRLCQEAAKHMIPNGGGKIINMASMTSFFGSYNISAYAASKGAIAQMTKAFSNEWSCHGINVNAIAPGGFKTAMTSALWSNDKVNEEAMSRTPAGRWGNSDDIMGAILFLSSSASDYVCGVILPVDGGYLVR